MDDFCALGDDSVCFEVCHSWKVWMRCCAVVAFVVVVRKDLPVIGAFHLPHVVEDIIIEVIEAVSFLLVDAFEVVLPSNLGLLLAIEVDPDKAVDIDVHVDREEAVSAAVEVGQLLVTRCLSKIAVQTV